MYDSALLTTAADNNFWISDHAAEYYQFAIYHYIGFTGKGILLAGGTGGGRHAPGIARTLWLERTREFGRTVYAEA